MARAERLGVSADTAAPARTADSRRCAGPRSDGNVLRAARRTAGTDRGVRRVSRLQRRTKTENVKPSVRLAPCRSSRSRSSPKTKRPISAPRSPRSPGPTRSSSSTRRAPTTPWRSRASTPTASSSATGPATSTQKNYAASLAAPRLDPVARRRRARHAGAGRARFGARCSRSRAHAAFRMPRVTWHLGRWIRTTDWYPDYQLRLYDRRAARVDRPLRARGGDGRRLVGRLRGELQHFAYRDIADHLETIDRYTTLAARQMHEDGRRAGLLQLAGHPPLAFLRNYLAQRRLPRRRRRASSSRR